MKEKIKELINKLNQQKEEEIEKTIDEFDVSKYTEDETDELINHIMFSYKEIQLEKLPYVLQALYKSNNKLKFYLFCIILKDSYEEIPFLTNLENIEIIKEKFQMFLPFLIDIANHSYNGIANCMYLILLKAVEEKDLFNKNSRNQIIEGLNEKLEMITEYGKNKTILEENTSIDLEIMIDVARYFHNQKTDIWIEKCWQFQNENILLFLVMYNLDKKKPIDKKIIEKIAGNILYAERLYSYLEKVKAQHLFPEQYCNQEYIAKSNMVNWLIYPTELGEIPNMIELVGTYEEQNEQFYVFHFTSNKDAFKKNEDMIGVSGGYIKQDLPTASNSGYTFSTFAKIEKDYINQAKGIVNMIKEYWKSQA